MKKILTVVICLSLIVSAGGCFRSKNNPSANNTVELTYYKLFDNEDIIQPMIQEFQSQYPYIRIKYKKFTDINEYEDLIINELAEGQGPDIFEIHNTWLPKHRKKITPLPSDFVTPEVFKTTFVDVAAQDLLAKDDTGQEQIYALPLTIDTLALYYNKDIFEDKIPSRGRPGATWEDIKEDVFKINKPDLSPERFAVSGIALGRGDNILRSTEILYLLFLQNNTEFYDPDTSDVIFANQQGISSLGQRIYPGVNALDLFTGFALPSNKHYSWNAYLADPVSQEKEVASFVKGKTAMIIGYSYLYENIQNLIKQAEDKGQEHIKIPAVQVTAIPQVNSPEAKTRVTYASYFAETVARTSAHPREAWKFIQFMNSQDNQTYYHTQTHRPTSRRDLIEDQKKEPIYGIFASQIGYAKSLVILDYDKYHTVFQKAINDVLNTIRPDDALQAAQNSIKKIMIDFNYKVVVNKKTPAVKK